MIKICMRFQSPLCVYLFFLVVFLRQAHCHTLGVSFHFEETSLIALCALKRRARARLIWHGNSLIYRRQTNMLIWLMENKKMEVLCCQFVTMKIRWRAARVCILKLAQKCNKSKNWAIKRGQRRRRVILSNYISTSSSKGFVLKRLQYLLRSTGNSVVR